MKSPNKKSNPMSAFGDAPKLSINVTTSSQAKQEEIYPDEDDDKLNKNAYCQWAKIDDGLYRAQKETFSKLPPGFYSVEQDGRSGRAAFKELKIKVDTLIRVPDSVANYILEEIDSFWKSEKTYSEMGFLHYRGYLLYGMHGSGKTSLVHMIVRNIIDEGGIAFMCKSPDFFVSGLSEFRAVEKDRKIVCLFEDIEAIIKTYGEDRLLAYLDGEYKIDKVLNIATTNYPEVLDKRIVSRPRRFDKVIKIEYPNEIARKEYFKTKLPKSEVNKWVKDSDGLSFASLAELVISVKILKKDFSDMISKLKDMQLKNVSSEDDDEDLGFSPSTPDA